MDPLSISAAALGLADITARLVSRVAKFVRDSKSVDEALRAFYSEISTLDINLRLVGKTILSHADLTSVPENGEFLTSFNETVGNVERTIQRLQQLIPETSIKESSSTFQKFLKQRRLDKKLPEISLLRLEVVSYNSSLQTILQAIDISLNMSIKTQTDPNRFADEFFRATNTLETQMGELRIDILKLVEASEAAQVQEGRPQFATVVASMQAAENFAQRVHSKASTISSAQSELNLETRSRTDNPNTRTVQSPSALQARQFDSSARADLELLQAQETLRQARKLYNSGSFFEAKELCSEALEELCEVENSDVDSLVEYTTLLQASILACMSGSTATAESQRLIETVDTKKLFNTATDDLVLDRMILLCWTKFRQSQFKETEDFTRILIRDARDWGGDQDNQHYSEALIILALAYYCQNRSKKARSLLKIMPNDYLYRKFLEKGFNSKESIELVSNQDRRAIFKRLSTPGHESASFHLIHFERLEQDQIFQAQFLGVALAQNSIPVIAMLATLDPVPLVMNHTCQCHGWAKGACSESVLPWQNIVSNDLVLDLTPLVEPVIRNGNYDVLQLLLDANTKEKTSVKLADLLVLPLHLCIRHDATGILFSLLGSYTYPDLDLNKMHPETKMTALSLASGLGSLVMVDILLQNGASVDNIDVMGQRPLHEAVKSRELRVVERIIKGGARIDSPTDSDSSIIDGEQPLQIKPEAIDWKGQAGLTPLLDWKRQTGLTPLQLAVGIYLYDSKLSQKMLNIIGVLVDAGADPTTKFLDQESCMHLAIDYGSMDLAYNLLLSKIFQKDIDRRYNGCTVLQWILKPHAWIYSVRSPRILDCIEVLIRCGANPMALDQDGQSCFHLAACRANGDRLLRNLLKSAHPANLQHRDAYGRTVADVVEETVKDTKEFVSGEELAETRDSRERMLSILQDHETRMRNKPKPKEKPTAPVDVKSAEKDHARVFDKLVNNNYNNI